MKWFIVAALLMAPTEALATTWKLVGESSDETTKSWIDTDSIRHTEDYTGAWYRMSLSDGRWFTTFSAFNCKAGSYMDLKMSVYDKRGTATNLDSTLKKQWDIPSPDSMMQGVVNAVCGNSW